MFGVPGLTLSTGTNDVNIPVEPSTAHLRLSSLIDQLNIGWPQATILVTTLIPAGKNNTQANIDAFNAQLPGSSAHGGPFSSLRMVLTVP